jgi:hypothetical protein
MEMSVLEEKFGSTAQSLTRVFQRFLFENNVPNCCGLPQLIAKFQDDRFLIGLWPTEDDPSPAPSTLFKNLARAKEEFKTESVVIWKLNGRVAPTSPSPYVPGVGRVSPWENLLSTLQKGFKRTLRYDGNQWFDLMDPIMTGHDSRFRVHANTPKIAKDLFEGVLKHFKEAYPKMKYDFHSIYFLFEDGGMEPGGASVAGAAVGPGPEEAAQRWKLDLVIMAESASPDPQLPPVGPSDVFGVGFEFIHIIESPNALEGDIWG